MIKNLVLGMTLLLMMACSNDNESKLFGKWQMTESEFNGQVTKVDTIFYNFQHELFEYQIVSPDAGVNMSRFGFCKMPNAEQLDLELTDGTGFLQYTDWSSDKRTFTIDQISGKKLILSSDGKRYYFHKF